MTIALFKMGRFIEFVQQVENNIIVDRIIPNTNCTIMLIISYNYIYFYFLNGNHDPITFPINDTVTGIFWSGHSDHYVIMCYNNGDIVLCSIYELEKVIKRINVQGLTSMRANSTMSSWGKPSLLVCTERCLKIITPFIDDELVIDKEEMNELEM